MDAAPLKSGPDSWRPVHAVGPGGLVMLCALYLCSAGLVHPNCRYPLLEGWSLPAYDAHQLQGATSCPWYIGEHLLLHLTVMTGLHVTESPRRQTVVQTFTARQSPSAPFSNMRKPLLLLEREGVPSSCALCLQHRLEKSRPSLVGKVQFKFHNPT